MSPIKAQLFIGCICPLLIKRKSMKIKRIICILLTLLMIFSMTACQSKEETSASIEVPTKATESATETTKATEAVIEATLSEEDLNRFRVEESLAANSQTVTYNTPKEYEDALHKMDFTEYYGDMVRLTYNSGVHCLPQSLTYNDEVFRLEFDYLDYADPSDTRNDIAQLTPVSGWILYGKKNADSAANISDFNISENIGNTSFNPFDGWEEDVPYEAMFYQFFNVSSDTGTGDVINNAYYYPNTKNLYNLFNSNPGVNAIEPDILNRGTDTPFSYEFVDEVNWGVEITEDMTTLYPLKIWVENPSEAWLKNHTVDDGDAEDVYYDTSYEANMTFLEWIEKYGHSHDWDIIGNMALYNPVNWNVLTDGMYFVENADKPIDELVKIRGRFAYLELNDEVPEGFAFVQGSELPSDFQNIEVVIP